MYQQDWEGESSDQFGYPQHNIEAAKEALYNSVYQEDGSGILAPVLVESGIYARYGQIHHDDWQRGALRAEERRVERYKRFKEKNELEKLKVKKKHWNMKPKPPSISSALGAEDVSKCNQEHTASDSSTNESYVALGCDVCDFVTPKGLENKEQQRQFDAHFLEKRHSVSSKVNIVIKTNENGEKEAVKVSVVVKAAYFAENPQIVFIAQTNVLVPQCPTCHYIFPTIWACAMHYEEFHDTYAANTYSLGVMTRSFHTLTKNKCHSCDYQGPNPKHLLEHWMSCPSHKTLGPTLSSKQSVYFICGPCNYVKMNYIDELFAHIFGAPFHKKEPDYDIIVSVVERTDKTYTHLPFCDTVSLEDRMEQDDKQLKLFGVKRKFYKIPKSCKTKTNKKQT